MIRVLFRWDRRPSQATAEHLRAVVRGVLGTLGEDNAEVHVLISSDEQLRELNGQYRGIDAATDVLSFADGELLPSGLKLLGELAISLDTARRQAVELGHDELRELSELVVHGTMHLLGYDHECDDGEMNKLELRIRREILR